MEIKNLTRNEIDELIELWSQSFIFPREQIAGWVNEENIKNCIGVFENNKLTSALNIIPFEFYIRGKVLPLAGIGGVATYPEYRGKNYIHYLLSEAIRIAREKGFIYSMLYPFSYEFYRNFGWELGGFQKRYILKTYNIPKFKEMEYVRKIPLEEYQLIKKIYYERAKTFTGPIKRDENRGESLIYRTRNLTYLYIYEKDEIEGYLLYSVDTTNVNKIIVKEMVFNNISAYKGFLALFSRQSMNIEEVHFTMPLTDNLPFILSNPRVNTNIEPTFMIRILDFEKAIKNLEFSEDINTTLRIQVIDEYAKWNNNIWRLEIKNKKVNLFEDKGYDLSIKIQTLSQIVAGVLDPIDAYKLGLIETKIPDTIHLLEKLFPCYNTFCWDYF